MKQWLLKLIARIQGFHAVDHVVADFHKAIAKLEAVAIHHDVLHDIHDNVAREATELRNAAAVEADRARQIVGRFRELLK